MARLNKQSLVDNLSLHRAFEDTPKYQVAEVIDYLFEIITEHVASGDDVTVAGFGKFEKAPKVRKDASGKFVPSGVYKPRLTAFKAFKDAVSAA